MKSLKQNRITVADMAPHIHSFLPSENKVKKIFSWLKDWIDLSLECRKIHPNDLMPSKADLACHIGVSQGTIQNAFRLLEDIGYLESKQRIGTYIKDRNIQNIEKLTSKRELAIEIIKKYINENDYKEGEILVSIRNLAKVTGISNATLRMAVINLVSNGILEKQGNNFVIKTLDYKIDKIQTQTLVEKIAEDLKKYITKNFKSGDKLPSNVNLVKLFNVSTKTIHDATKLLTKEGLLYSRRGQYGTIVIDPKVSNIKNEIYNYEKFEKKIRNYIYTQCNIGDKLPSIKFLSQKYNTSEKTIKKALDNLADEGFVTFIRGRHGGTFVMDIPQDTAEAYKWLAISNDYMPN